MTCPTPDKRQLRTLSSDAVTHKAGAWRNARPWRPIYCVTETFIVTAAAAGNWQLFCVALCRGHRLHCLVSVSVVHVIDVVTNSTLPVKCRWTRSYPISFQFCYSQFKPASKLCNQNYTNSVIIMCMLSYWLSIVHLLLSCSLFACSCLVKHSVSLI